MALIKCRECKKKISDQAATCPYCGCPILGNQNNDTFQSENKTENKDYSAPKNRITVIIGIVLVLVILALSVFFYTKNKEKKESISLTLTETALNSTEFSLKEKQSEENESILINDISESSSTKAETITTTREPKISRIYQSDIEETDDEYIVTVSFYGDEYGLKPKTGYLDIKIENDKKERVYSKKEAFNGSNFSQSTWGGLYCYGFRFAVSKQSISAGLTDDGTITVIAAADGVEFAPFTRKVFDLPVKSVRISLPSLPCSFSDYDYDNSIEATVRIDDIKMSQEFVGEYATINLTILSTTTFSSTRNTAKIVHVGYQLKNSAGIIVDSGTFRLESSFVGDKTETRDTLYHLDLSEQYSLVLINSVG